MAGSIVQMIIDKITKMELTLKYYYYFDGLEDELGDYLNTPASWDVLRTNDGAQKIFSISEDRETWQKTCLSNEQLKSKAKDIVKIVTPEFNCVCSFGVGAGYLEYLIKKEEPSLQVKCSDFSPQGIERLKKVFLEADEVVTFDMIQGDWERVDSQGICLFYRVSEMFDDAQWRRVFYKMKHAGIKGMLFVPSEILTFKKILYQQFKYIIFRLLRRRMTFSGYLRNEQRFISILSEFYEIVQVVDVGEAKGFLLKLRTESK